MLLTVNAGSSSLKFALFSAPGRRRVPQRVLTGHISGIGSSAAIHLSDGSGTRINAASLETRLLSVRNVADAAPLMIQAVAEAGFSDRRINMTSHRLVHGGSDFVQPTIIDVRVRERLGTLEELAPLHMPAGLAALDGVLRALPKSRHVACFDTAFHASIEPLATRLPLPKAWRDKGYRRYGFHGLNYEHIVASFTDATGTPLPKRLLVLHLGNGCSAAAIVEGRCVASTMGYSPLDGLIMGTRTGSLDPGVVLALAREPGMTLDRLEKLLWRESGLLGLSDGFSSDMRELLSSKKKGAREAVGSFCYAAAQHCGGLAMAMGGLDAVVFTAGIGENAAPVRTEIVRRLGWLGATIDEASNRSNATRLSPNGASIAVWRIAADEELVLARHGFAMADK